MPNPIILLALGAKKAYRAAIGKSEDTAQKAQKSSEDSSDKRVAANNRDISDGIADGIVIDDDSPTRSPVIEQVHSFSALFRGRRTSNKNSSGSNINIINVGPKANMNLCDCVDHTTAGAIDRITYTTNPPAADRTATTPVDCAGGLRQVGKIMIKGCHFSVEVIITTMRAVGHIVLSPPRGPSSGKGSGKGGKTPSNNNHNVSGPVYHTDISVSGSSEPLAVLVPSLEVCEEGEAGATVNNGAMGMAYCTPQRRETGFATSWNNNPLNLTPLPLGNSSQISRDGSPEDGARNTPGGQMLSCHEMLTAEMQQAVGNNDINGDFNGFKDFENERDGRSPQLPRVGSATAPNRSLRRLSSTLQKTPITVDKSDKFIQFLRDKYELDQDGRVSKQGSGNTAVSTSGTGILSSASTNAQLSTSACGRGTSTTGTTTTVSATHNTSSSAGMGYMRSGSAFSAFHSVHSAALSGSSSFLRGGPSNPQTSAAVFQLDADTAFSDSDDSLAVSGDEEFHSTPRRPHGSKHATCIDELYAASFIGNRDNNNIDKYLCVDSRGAVTAQQPGQQPRLSGELRSPGQLAATERARQKLLKRRGWRSSSVTKTKLYIEENGGLSQFEATAASRNYTNKSRKRERIRDFFRGSKVVSVEDQDPTNSSSQRLQSLLPPEATTFDH